MPKWPTEMEEQKQHKAAVRNKYTLWEVYGEIPSFVLNLWEHSGASKARMATELNLSQYWYTSAYFSKCKHHVIQVNCFFVFFVARYLLQHVYIYDYIFIFIYDIFVYLPIYLYIHWDIDMYIMYDIYWYFSMCACFCSGHLRNMKGDTPKGEFFGFHLPDKRTSGTGPCTPSQSMGGWLLRLVVCFSRHVPR